MKTCTCTESTPTAEVIACLNRRWYERAQIKEAA